MADESLDYTTPFQLTKTIRRDPYDALSTTNPGLSAAGKVIVITGGGTGLGAVSVLMRTRSLAIAFAHLTEDFGQCLGSSRSLGESWGRGRRCRWPPP